VSEKAYLRSNRQNSIKMTPKRQFRDQKLVRPYFPHNLQFSSHQLGTSMRVFLPPNYLARLRMIGYYCSLAITNTTSILFHFNFDTPQLLYFCFCTSLLVQSHVCVCECLISLSLFDSSISVTGLLAKLINSKNKQTYT
jgi:hypothetical protein